MTKVELSPKQLDQLWLNVVEYCPSIRGPTSHTARTTRFNHLVSLLNAPRLADVVARIDGQSLASGGSFYRQAVVVSLEPFVLVSCAGDMLWRETIDYHDFASIGRATTGECLAAFKRWERENNLAWPKLKRDWPGHTVMSIKESGNGWGKYPIGTVWKVKHYRQGLDLESLPDEEGNQRRTISKVPADSVILVGAPEQVTVTCRNCGHTLTGSAQKGGVPEYGCPKCKHGSGMYEKTWELSQLPIPA